MATELELNPITGKLDLVQDLTETIDLADLSDVLSQQLLQMIFLRLMVLLG